MRKEITLLLILFSTIAYSYVPIIWIAMRKMGAIIVIISICFNVSGQQSNETVSDTVYQGEYLGLNFPDTIPEIFAPNLISGKGRMHCFPSFSADNGEIYWQILPPKILTVKQINGKWTNPELTSFSNTRNNQAPFLAYDNTIYFSSSRDGGQGSLDIWYITKKDGKYNEPNNIGTKINTDKLESQPTVSKNRTIYYTGTFQGKLYNKGIYYSNYKSGEYNEPKLLPEPINILDTLILDYTPFIASDESYLLFSSNRQNPERELCHIYLSYKKDNGEWSVPVDLSLKMNFNGSSKFPVTDQSLRIQYFQQGVFNFQIM